MREAWETQFSLWVRKIEGGNGNPFQYSCLREVKEKVVLSCLTLCDPMDNTVHGILLSQGSNSGFPHCRRILYQLSHQVRPRILEWVAYPFSSESSQPRNLTRVSCIAGRFFASWNMIKDIGEEPDEEIHGARFEGELGEGHPPSVDVFTHLEVLRTPFCWDFMEVSSRGRDGSLTPFPPPPLSGG